jgi:hypothetical protein
MTMKEPWRRFEAKVDPTSDLAPHESARRAKIAYRAFMRGIARKSVKIRAATKARKDAARRRALARPPTEAELVAFREERATWMAVQILLAAAQRGEKGIAGLRKRQLAVRDDCLLCRRPFQ